MFQCRREEIVPGWRRITVIRMVIYGVDFTSSPTAKKPITCAVASLEEANLTVTQTTYFSSFQAFENFLRSPGPWRAGFDFPFGQPRNLLENLEIEGNWAECVAWLTGRARGDFEKLLAAYREPRPEGDKHHFRRTDELGHLGISFGICLYEPEHREWDSTALRIGQKVCDVFCR